MSCRPGQCPINDWMSGEECLLCFHGTLLHSGIAIEESYLL